MGSFRLSGHFQWFPFQFLWYPLLRTSRLFDVPSRVVSDLFFLGIVLRLIHRVSHQEQGPVSRLCLHGC